ncbi:hypothetical protein [Alteromonas halophila]|uniref:PEGA domain-containing protein n=1 Tax=Alteromonas halophila TaxID=516698 RepID=A0A918MUI2_9ALTE|nr:hypothetical protein [Alteromonas halophila]GGW76214.1 hypothetical protein GCM10007391_05930 [Alteromonas halophila]
MASKCKYAAVITVSLLLLSACFGPTGKVRIKTDIEKAQLLIDGEKASSIGKDFIELEVTAELHLFEVKALSEDEEWRYYGSEELLIPENATLEKHIYTQSKATEKRQRRLALEAKRREADNLADKVKREFLRRQAQEGGK